MLELMRANVVAHSRRYIASALATTLAVAFIVASLASGSVLYAQEMQEFDRQYSQTTVLLAPTYNEADPIDGSFFAFDNPSGEGTPGGTGEEATDAEPSDEGAPTGGDPTEEGIPGDAGEEADATVPGMDGGLGDVPPLEFTVVDVADKLKDLPSVNAVDIRMDAYVNLTNSHGSTQVLLENKAPKPLKQPPVIDGRLPNDKDEVAVGEHVRDKLKLSIGDTVTADTSMGYGHGQNHKVTVVGFLRKPIPSASAGDNIATQETLRELRPDFLGATGISVYSRQAQSDSAKATQLQRDVREALGDFAGATAAKQYVSVKTYDQLKKDAQEENKKMQASVSAGLMLFVVLAVIVSSLVISTTFTVVMARREKEFGLLRCIAMTKRSIRLMVLGEATIIGIVASLIGTVVGFVLMTAVLVHAHYVYDFHSAFLYIQPWIMGVAFLAGVILTIVSALASMRRAGNTSPMAALTTAGQAQPTTTGKHVAVTIVGAIIFAGGIASMVYGIHKGRFTYSLAGGAVSFIGMLILVAVIISHLVYLVTRPTAVRQPLWDMAGLNARAHPGRTGATAVALILGITLTSMIIVGKTSLETTINAMMDKAYPVDITLDVSGAMSFNPLTPESQLHFSDDQISRLRELNHVQAVREVRSVPVTIDNNPVRLMERDDLADIAHVRQQPIPDGTILTSTAIFEGKKDLPVSIQVTDKDLPAVPDTPGTQSHDAGRFTIKGDYTIDMPQAFASPETFKQIPGSSHAAASRIYIKLDKNVSMEQVMDTMAQVTTIAPSADVGGAAPIRAMFAKVLNVMMLIILVLLGVSVLVALVGVTNTMSLSVVERRHEIGLMRALGLTKRQTKSMVTLEAIIIVGVSVIIGLIAGIAYGIAGLYALPLGEDTTRIIDIPWLYIALIAVGAIAAAALATWLPARTASKVTPVEAIEAP